MGNKHIDSLKDIVPTASQERVLEEIVYRSILGMRSTDGRLT
jgi:hypothetical protein